MSDAHKDAARSALQAHKSSIDTLHQQLASVPGVDKDRLQSAVDKYKGAHQAFTEDALGCMN